MSHKTIAIYLSRLVLGLFIMFFALEGAEMFETRDLLRGYIGIGAACLLGMAELILPWFWDEG